MTWMRAHNEALSKQGKCHCWLCAEDNPPLPTKPKHRSLREFREHIAARMREREASQDWRPSTKRTVYRPVKSAFDDAHIDDGVFHVGDRYVLGWSLTSTMVGDRLVIGVTGNPKLTKKAARAFGHWLVAVAKQ